MDKLSGTRFVPPLAIEITAADTLVPLFSPPRPSIMAGTRSLPLPPTRQPAVTKPSRASTATTAPSSAEPSAVVLGQNNQPCFPKKKTTKKAGPKKSWQTLHQRKVSQRKRPSNNSKKRYNGFNIFFMLERQRLLHSRGGGVTNAIQNPIDINDWPILKHLKLTLPPLCERYAHLPLTKNWFLELNANKYGSKKKPHRKSHGLITFKELARMAADNYRGIDPETKQFIDEVTKILRRHCDESEYMEQNGRKSLVGKAEMVGNSGIPAATGGVKRVKRRCAPVQDLIPLVSRVSQSSDKKSPASVDVEVKKPRWSKAEVETVQQLMGMQAATHRSPIIHTAYPLATGPNLAVLMPVHSPQGPNPTNSMETNLNIRQCRELARPIEKYQTILNPANAYPSTDHFNPLLHTVHRPVHLSQAPSPANSIETNANLLTRPIEEDQPDIDPATYYPTDTSRSQASSPASSESSDPEWVRQELSRVAEARLAFSAASHASGNEHPSERLKPVVHMPVDSPQAPSPVNSIDTNLRLCQDPARSIEGDGPVLLNPVTYYPAGTTRDHVSIPASSEPEWFRQELTHTVQDHQAVSAASNTGGCECISSGMPLHLRQELVCVIQRRLETEKRMEHKIRLLKEGVLLRTARDPFQASLHMGYDQFLTPPPLLPAMMSAPVCRNVEDAAETETVMNESEESEVHTDGLSHSGLEN